VSSLLQSVGGRLNTVKRMLAETIHEHDKQTSRYGLARDLFRDSDEQVIRERLRELERELASLDRDVKRMEDGK
jgi:hypothetical protein